MSSLVSFIFKWNALSDACPKCRSLNTKEYRDVDIYRGVVWDPIWGDVWNLDGGHSLAHRYCRCQLATRVEEADDARGAEIMVLLQAIKQEFQEAVNQLRART